MKHAWMMAAAAVSAVCIILLFGVVAAGVDRVISGRGGALFAPAAEETREHPSLLVTVPDLDIRRVPTKYAPASDKAALRHGFMHVKGTDYPWTPRGNVYLAGHDLGFPGTESWRLLWDLDTLMKGDRITLEGPDGNRYDYRVYESEVIEPTETRVLGPQRIDGEPGRVVSLQVCVPHWMWTHRLVVRGKLVGVRR